MTKEEFIKTLDIFEIEEIKDYCLNGSNKQNKKITLRNNIETDEDKINKLEQDLKTTILIANKRQETIQYYEKIVNEAIKYIKKNTRTTPFENYKYLQIDDEEIKNLLNILKGSNIV